MKMSELIERMKLKKAASYQRIPSKFIFLKKVSNFDISYFMVFRAVRYSAFLSKLLN